MAGEAIARKKGRRVSISEPKEPEHTAHPRDFTNSSLHNIASFYEFKFKFDFKSLSLFFKSIYLFIIYILCVFCLHVTTYMQYLQRPEESIRSPGTVTNGCVSPQGC